jgi:excisionase family DNA binding protein
MNSLQTSATKNAVAMNTQAAQSSSAPPHPAPRGEVVMTTEEAAKYLQIHPRTLTRLAWSGSIPAFQIGSHWRFLQSELDSWMRSEVRCNTNSSLSASTGKER